MENGTPLIRVLTRVGLASFANPAKKTEKVPKTAPKSFAQLLLQVSPLFHLFATVDRLYAVRKLLILLKGAEGGGYGVLVNIA